MKPNCKPPILSVKCQRIDVYQCCWKFKPIIMSNLEQWCKICFLNKIYASTTSYLGRKKKGNISISFVWHISLTMFMAFIVTLNCEKHPYTSAKPSFCNWYEHARWWLWLGRKKKKEKSFFLIRSRRRSARVRFCWCNSCHSRAALLNSVGLFAN